jgi:Fic family protein
MYIYEWHDWPHFTWNLEKISNLLSEVSFLQGRILGKMKSLGFTFQQEAILKNLTEEITKSSEIEGELLNTEQVRSSIARRLNIQNNNPVASSHHIDGIVEMMIDATHNYNKKITLDRLCAWHASLFPTGYSGMYKINVGQMRDDKDGPMQVVSSSLSRPIVYYEAPAADKLPQYMDDFLTWINEESDINPVIKSAITHLWFVSLHPFDDGNGRITRALTDMMLSKAEDTSYRFYSISAQIQKDKKEYYNILERTQKGTLDITEWLEWFLQCLAKSIRNSESLADKIVHKALCWQEFNKVPLDQNQQKMINMLFDGFEGNLTSGKWAKICKCSQDTAIRSIKYLIENNILQQEGTGRSTHYILKCGEKG